MNDYHVYRAKGERKRNVSSREKRGVACLPFKVKKARRAGTASQKVSKARNERDSLENTGHHLPWPEPAGQGCSHSSTHTTSTARACERRGAQAETEQIRSEGRLPNSFSLGI